MAATKKGRKTGSKKAKSTEQHWFLRYHVALWVVVLSLTVLTLVAVLRLPGEHRLAVPVAQKSQKVIPVAPVARAQKPLRQRAVIDEDEQVYEEQDDGMETRVKEVDLAIIQTLVLRGYDPARLVHGEMDIRKHQGHEYHFQRLELAGSEDEDLFAVTLKKNLELLVEGGTLNENSKDHEVTVEVFGVPTHCIVFCKTVKTRPEMNHSSDQPPRLVVVIDDLGRSVSAGRRLAQLAFPVTFSVMPYESHTLEVAAVARNKGKELILHLPMEPERYPAVRPGPGALMVTMSRGEIRTTLEDDLTRVPGAIGANNHMGSRFTRDTQGMDEVIGILKKRGLFFLDSMTSSKSCVASVMKGQGMPYLRRNIFLDNVRDEKAILFQLRKAESLAQKNGFAVAIGHPYPETLGVLEDWQRARDRDVEMVTLKELF